MAGEVMPSSDIVVFVHGMANFSVNRGTKAEQEQLLKAGLPDGLGFLGAYDDSGNFAFRSRVPEAAIHGSVLAALRTRFKTKGAVALSRASCASALAAVETAVRQHYGTKFNPANYSVIDKDARWRVGLVFLDSPELDDATKGRLFAVEDEELRILSISNGSVGVLKYDQGPRIPWGDPAGQIERRTGGSSPTLATGRSARTVRGVLRLFSR